jgi:hypothetical protein
MEIISVNSILYFLEIFGMNGENKPKTPSSRVFIKPTIVVLLFSSSVKNGTSGLTGEIGDLKVAPISTIAINNKIE